ncbi:MAG: restriction endonuclease subunit S, partial [Sulfurovaceae bacterium]|nr:restriction endonuclease subunit S [Sulfurovaceae bacterium]
VGDLFEINNTLSFNKDSLVVGYEYDYVTRTSQNQGILQETGFVNTTNINSDGNWSLGLMQMDFFYRERPWYAGQFVRKITPKIELNKSFIIFLTVALNKLKPKLLTILVRNIDKEFLNSKIQLPTKNDEINFDFMERFIAEMETERIAELEAYLSAAGLKNSSLTLQEQQALDDFKDLNFEEFNVINIFNVKNSGNILSRDIIENRGETPYLCSSNKNNAVSSYISYDEEYLDKGNCVFIGGKTFVVSYQEKDFYSNDSHNLILYLKNEEKRNKFNQLFLATCINKSLGHKYSWGDSISNRKIQKDEISLPTQNNQPDYSSMETFISAIQKLVIKDVVHYADNKIGFCRKKQMFV